MPRPVLGDPRRIDEGTGLPRLSWSFATLQNGASDGRSFARNVLLSGGLSVRQPIVSGCARDSGAPALLGPDGDFIRRGRRVPTEKSGAVRNLQSGRRPCSHL